MNCLTFNKKVMKAFLGMGLLGANFVQAMLAKGDQVRVWSRTASKAAQLEKFGAKAFQNITEAVAGADIVHLTLVDDATVDEVLEAARPGLKPERSSSITRLHPSLVRWIGPKYGGSLVFPTSMHRYSWGRPMRWRVRVPCWYRVISL